MCLVSGALALVFPVSVMCCPGFPGCFPESRPWVLSLGAIVIRHSLHVMSSCRFTCGQGSAGMSMSSACFGCVASVSLWDTIQYKLSSDELYLSHTQLYRV